MKSIQYCFGNHR